MARTTSGRTARTGRGRSGPHRGTLPTGWFSRPEQHRFWLICGFLIRRRAELTVITVFWIGFVQVEAWITPATAGWMSPTTGTWIITAAAVTVVLAVPPSRRYVFGRCWAVITRHRMRACFCQTRTWTANGRMPFLMSSRPSHVGERVRVWLPAGLAVKDLERVTDELAAACWAREARITPIRGQAALVLVDIVRHDPLASRRAVTPPVLDDVAATGTTGPTRRPTWLPDPGDLTGTGPITTPSPWAPPSPPGSPVTPTTAGTNGTTKNGKTPSGTAAGQAEPPGVTGFGGVDVTDYV